MQLQQRIVFVSDVTVEVHVHFDSVQQEQFNGTNENDVRKWKFINVYHQQLNLIWPNLVICNVGMMQFDHLGADVDQNHGATNSNDPSLTPAGVSVRANLRLNPAGVIGQGWRAGLHTRRQSWRPVQRCYRQRSDLLASSRLSGLRASHCSDHCFF